MYDTKTSDGFQKHSEWIVQFLVYVRDTLTELKNPKSEITNYIMSQQFKSSQKTWLSKWETIISEFWKYFCKSENVMRWII